MKPLTTKQLAVFRTHSDGRWFTPSEHHPKTLESLADRGLLEYREPDYYRVPQALIGIAHYIYEGENWSPDVIAIDSQEYAEHEGDF